MPNIRCATDENRRDPLTRRDACAGQARGWQL